MFRNKFYPIQTFQQLRYNETLKSNNAHTKENKTIIYFLFIYYK